MKHYVTLFVIGVVLRLVQLGAGRLWYDEAFTRLLAGLDLYHMIQATAGDTHPPLYYFLVPDTSNTLLIRLPSFVLSLLGMYVFYLLLQKLTWPESTKLYAFGLMCILPFGVHFAQEARMYSLLQVLVLTGLLWLLEKRWMGLAAVSGLILYTHNYGLFYVAALGLSALVIYRRDVLKPWLALAVGGLAWLPWFFVLLGQMGIVVGGYWIQPVTPGAVLYSMYMLFFPFAMPDMLQPISALIVFGVLVLMVIRVAENKPDGWQWMFVLAFAPLLMAVLVSLAWRPMLLFRGLAGSAPIVYALVGWTLGRYPLQRSYSYALLLPVLVFGMYGHYAYNVEAKSSQTDMLVQDVRQGWQDGDVLVYLSDDMSVLLQVYAPELEQIKLPDCGHTAGSLSPQTRAAIGTVEGVPLGDYWLVTSVGPTSNPCVIQQAELAQSGGELISTYRDDELVTIQLWRVNR